VLAQLPQNNSNWVSRSGTYCANLFSRCIAYIFYISPARKSNFANEETAAKATVVAVSTSKHHKKERYTRSCLLTSRPCSWSHILHRTALHCCRQKYWVQVPKQGFSVCRKSINNSMMLSFTHLPIQQCSSTDYITLRPVS